MNFIGIDLHTNRFTCCYRTERSAVDNPKDRIDQKIKQFQPYKVLQNLLFM